MATEVTREVFERMKAQENGFQKFEVVSGSMLPLIRVGDSVVVAVGAAVKRFDVVAFWGGDKLICHVLWHINRRVSVAGGQLYLTCPLSVGGADLAITDANMLGPVVNFRLGLWQKLKLTWRLRRLGL